MSPSTPLHSSLARRCRHTLTFSLALLLLLALPLSLGAQSDPHAQALAQLEPEAQQRFGELLGQAQGSFERGDFARALTLLDEAYAIYPHPRILYKIAEAHERAGHDAEALEAYQRYLDSGDQAEDRAMILGLIANLERRLAEPATLALDTSPTNALVYLDDQPDPIGATPLRYPLPPGEHTVRLELEGHSAQTFTLSAAPRATLTVERTLEPEPPVVITTPPPLTPDPAARRIGLASATLGVLGGASFLFAATRASALERALDQRATSARPSDYPDEVRRHNVGVIAGWSLTSLALLGAGWSLWRWTHPRIDAPTLSLSPHLSPGGAAMTLEVSF